MNPVVVRTPFTVNEASTVMDEPSKKIKGTLLYSRRDATHTHATTADDGTISLIAKKKHEFVIEKKTDTSHGEGFFLRP